LLRPTQLIFPWREDRARLARELDDAKAHNAEYEQKAAQWEQTEKEFSDLAGETMAELDAVIRRVQQALRQGSGGGSA